MRSAHAQTWGWLVAGVLAMGLNGLYHDGGAAGVQGIADQIAERVADRSETLVQSASERVDRLTERVELAAALFETAACRLAGAVERAESRIAQPAAQFDRFEVVSAREEAQIARLEINRARIETQLARVRFAPSLLKAANVRVVCPRVRASVPRVQIPRPPSLPVVHIERVGAGPV